LDVPEKTPEGHRSSVSATPRGEASASSDLLRSVLYCLSDGVVVADHEGRIVYSNPAARAIVEFGPEELTPADWASAFGCYLPDMVTLFSAEQLPLSRAIRGESVKDCEVYVRNARVPNGLWVSVNASPLRNREGAVIGGVITFRDTTSRNRQAGKLELLSNVVEQTADSVVITDETGSIEYVNPAFEATTGFSGSEALGQTPKILRSGKHDEKFYQDLWTTLVNGEVFRGTITNRKKTGDLFVSEQTITPMEDPSGRIHHFVSVGKDITELQKATQRESQLRLARSVQQRLYPRVAPEIDGYRIAGAAVLADVTGGDYFDYVALRDDLQGLIIGDASGHGFNSALLMAQTRASLRSVAQTQSDPGVILRALNRLLAADATNGNFVTMLIAVLDPRTGLLGYASAGHTTGYVIDSSGDVKEELRSTGIPLAVLPDTTFETVRCAALEAGDMVALLTDGITEAHAPDGSMLGAEGVLRLIREHDDASASEILGRLLGGTRDFAQGEPPHDDVTAVICKKQKR
jgi:sigma-B regulation protein RsbU (phosphoserine phosphatase)